MSDLNVVQVVIAPWDDDRNKRTYSLFALGDDGRIYRLEKANGGWRPMAKRILTVEQRIAIDKKKYGGNYKESEVDDEQPSKL